MIKLYIIKKIYYIIYIMNNFLRQLIFGIDNYTYQQQSIINTYGKNIITEIQVCRKPVQGILKKTLNVLSFGKFLNNLKKSPYDDVYHLFIIIKLDNNIQILLEKNERISIKVLNKNELSSLFNSENINIDLLNKEIIFMDLLNNTYKNMGKNYFIYDSSLYNCQNFVMNILKSNEIYDIKYEKFIYQNPIYLFHNLSYLKKFNNVVTNIGAKFNLLITGSGVPKYYHNNIKFKNNNYNNKSFKKINKIIKLIPDEKLFIVYYKPNL